MKNRICIKGIIISIFTLLSIVGCTNDNDLNITTDYGKLRLGRMDLSGAVSIGFKTKSGSTRAIDGEYVSAGLYKIDDKGNISAVAVYFTTDTLGNRLEHEEKLRIVPEALFDLTNDYLIVADCKYYDSDGDKVQNKWEPDENNYSLNLVRQEVPYKNLLIRKSDGKIWCIDAVSDNLLDYNEWYRDYNLLGTFIENKSSILYFCHNYGLVYKFNLTSDNPSFEQISKGIAHDKTTFHVIDNDIVWSYKRGLVGLFNDVIITWPNSGFQIMKPYVSDVLGDTVKKVHVLSEDFVLKRDVSSRHYISINNQPYVLIGIESKWSENNIPSWVSYSDRFKWYQIVKDDYLWDEVACLGKIVIGENPGSCYVDKDVIALHYDGPKSCYSSDTYRRFIIGSVFVSSEYILTTIKDSRWISMIDLKNKKWTFLKELPFEVDFDNALEYDGKIWSINEDKSNLGAWWFDPNSLEHDFVPYNITMPGYIYMVGDKSKVPTDGYVIYRGTNPSTGNSEKIVVDITTGNSVEQSVFEPEMLFEQLIPLN